MHETVEDGAELEGGFHVPPAAFDLQELLVAHPSGRRLAWVTTAALSAGRSLRPRNRSTSVEDRFTLAWRTRSGQISSSAGRVAN